MTRLVWLGCLAYLTIALGELGAGAVLEPMVHAYGVGYGDGGQLVMNQFLGGLVGTLSAPWLVRRVGRKTVLLSAFAMMAVAEAVYAALPPWGVMLAVAPLTGLGFGMIETLVGSLMIEGAGERANTAMSRLETMFGVGALIIPFAGAALIGIGQWRLAFAFVALLAAATFALWLRFWPAMVGSGRVPAKRDAAGREAEKKPPVRAPKQQRPAAKPVLGRGLPVMLACALFFLIYVGMEMSFVHYLPSMLVQEDGLSDWAATLALSVFWGAMTIGRMVSGAIADRFGGAAYLLVVCLAAAILFLLMGWTGGTVAMFVLTFLAGLFMSGMFAVALVFANRAVPGITERTTSILIACGLLGGAALPRLTGWWLDRFDVDATRWLFAAIALLMLAVIGAAVALARRAGGLSTAAGPAGDAADSAASVN